MTVFADPPRHRGTAAAAAVVVVVVVVVVVALFECSVSPSAQTDSRSHSINLFMAALSRPRLAFIEIIRASVLLLRRICPGIGLRIGSVSGYY